MSWKKKKNAELVNLINRFITKVEKVNNHNRIEVALEYLEVSFHALKESSTVEGDIKYSEIHGFNRIAQILHDMKNALEETKDISEKLKEQLKESETK